MPNPVERKERMARCLLAQTERLSGDGSLPALSGDLPAIRWAWRWLAGMREGESVLRFARALAGPLRRCWGDPLEAVELLQAALAWARVSEPEVASGLESQLAATEAWLGRLDAAEARLRALLERDLTLDETALAHMRLGAVLSSRGHCQQAVEARLVAIAHLRGARGCSEGHGRTLWLAWALHGLAQDRQRLGDNDGARAALEESETLFLRLGCAPGLSAVLAERAVADAAQQEPEAAAWHAREALQMAERAGDTPGRARSLQVLGRVTGLDDPSTGLALLAQAAAAWEQLCRPLGHASALLDAAELAAAGEGFLDLVLQNARAALQLGRQHGFHAVETLALTLLVEAHSRAGRRERAEACAAAARHACARTDEPRVRQRCADLEQRLRSGPQPGSAADLRQSAPEPVQPGHPLAAASSVLGAEPRHGAAAGPPLLVRLLGPLRVEGTAGALSRERLRPKEQRVLARLALEPGQLVPRDEFLELFWPHSHPQAAERSLRTVVSSLRAGLRAVLSDPPPPLITGRMEGYLLEAPVCAVDVVMFTAAIQEARAAAGDAPDRALSAWQRAVELYDGDLLCNFPYDDWCLGLRERLRVNLLDGLYQLARAALAAESHEQAQELALRMVGLDPAEERAHRLLMRCYARMGSPGEAVRQFERCREALWEELGAQPARATLSLYEAIRNGAAPEAEEPGDPVPGADGKAMFGLQWVDASSPWNRG
jgi:DNA-binding SARP family transcriptional activator